MHALRSAVIPPNARAKVESLRVRRGHSAQCPRMASWFPTSGVETPNGCALEFMVRDHRPIESNSAVMMRRKHETARWCAPNLQVALIRFDAELEKRITPKRRFIRLWGDGLCGSHGHPYAVAGRGAQGTQGAARGGARA